MATLYATIGAIFNQVLAIVQNTLSPFTNDFRIIKSINFEIEPNYLTLKWASHRTTNNMGLP